MKVKLLPLAIAAAMAAPAVAMADVSVYGKMNVSVDMHDVDPAGDAGDYDQWELNSWDSRLGVKGEEKISDALTGFYQAEFLINVDAGGGADDVLGQRNIFVGLKGNWGAVQLGKFDTPLKLAQGKIDQFGDTPGDIKGVVNGENRTSDLIQYTTPKFADAIVASIALQPGEDECNEAGEAAAEAADGSCSDGIADGMSASVAYDANGIYVALAHDSAMASNNPGIASTSLWDNTRLVAMATIGQFELGALYQTGEQSEPAEADERDGYVVSAGFKLDSVNKLKFQYGATELTDGPTDETTDITLAAFGYENALSKQTKLYVHYVMLEEEVDGADEADEETYFQVGVDHKF